MTAAVIYSTIRNGRPETVTAEHGSKAQQRRWRELGVNLHEQMDAAIAEARLSLAEHPEDDEHNIAVGRAAEMMVSGDVRGGIAFYCAWAKQAGYPGISLVSWDPLQVDVGLAIGGMIAELRGGETTILTAGDWVKPGYMRAPRSMFIPIAAWGKLVLPVRAES